MCSETNGGRLTNTSVQHLDQEQSVVQEDARDMAEQAALHFTVVTMVHSSFTTCVRRGAVVLFLGLPLAMLFVARSSLVTFKGRNKSAGRGSTR